MNGLEGGSPQLQKTVLPVLAEANVSIRLAPGQDARLDRGRVQNSSARPRRRAPRSRSSCSPPATPGLIDPDAPAIQLALDAFERSLGTRPLLIRSGGTLPIVPALATRGSRPSSPGSRSPSRTSTRRTSGSCTRVHPARRGRGARALRQLARAALGAKPLQPPKCRIASMNGSSASPFGVSSYSTRGGAPRSSGAEDPLLLERA